MRRHTPRGPETTPEVIASWRAAALGRERKLHADPREPDRQRGFSGRARDDPDAGGERHTLTIARAASRLRALFGSARPIGARRRNYSGLRVYSPAYLRLQPTSPTTPDTRSKPAVRCGIGSCVQVWDVMSRGRRPRAGDGGRRALIWAIPCY